VIIFDEMPADQRQRVRNQILIGDLAIEQMVYPFVKTPKLPLSYNLSSDSPMIINAFQTTNLKDELSLKCLTRLRRDLQTLTENRIAGDLVTPDKPYTRDFGGLGCLTGFRQDPRSYFFIDNRTVVKDTEVSKKKRAELLVFVEWLTQVASSCWAPKGISLSKISNTGHPFFDADYESRKADFYKNVAEIEMITELIKEEDYYELAETYNIVFGSQDGLRQQVDPTTEEDGKLKSKPRYSITIEQMRILADKTIEGVPEFIRCRARTYLGLASRINDLLRCVLGGMLRFLSKLFPKTLHTQGRKGFEVDIQRYTNFLALDKPGADTQMVYDVLYTAVHAANWSDFFKKLMWDTLRAPILFRGNGTGYEAAYYGWISNPTDQIDDRFYGMPSGHTFVALGNKIAYLAENMWLLADCFKLPSPYEDEELWFKILRHESVYAIFNHGDDVLFAFIDEDETQFLYHTFRQYMENLDQDDYPVNPMRIETPVKFTGFVVMANRDPWTNKLIGKGVLELRWLATQDLVSWVEHQWVNERTVPPILIQWLISNGIVKNSAISTLKYYSEESFWKIAQLKSTEAVAFEESGKWYKIFDKRLPSRFGIGVGRLQAVDLFVHIEEEFFKVQMVMEQCLMEFYSDNHSQIWQYWAELATQIENRKAGDLSLAYEDLTPEELDCLLTDGQVLQWKYDEDDPRIRESIRDLFVSMIPWQDTIPVVKTWSENTQILTEDDDPGQWDYQHFYEMRKIYDFRKSA